MIAIDTSAMIAILRPEPEAAAYSSVIAADQGSCMSAVCLQEASFVLAGRNGSEKAWEDLEDFIRVMEVQVVPHDLRLALIARAAFLTFGKGRHTTSLNLADCASYALAKARSIPLLFKGADFARTDVVPAHATPA